MMRIHRLFLIAGAIMIAAQLTGCGQNGSTGGGTNATPTPANVPSPTVANTPLPTASTGPVTLRVGATTYHTSDTISVTLSNQSTRAIYFPDHLTNCTVILLAAPGGRGLAKHQCVQAYDSYRPAQARSREESYG